jgi:hypothetical protein
MGECTVGGGMVQLALFAPCCVVFRGLKGMHAFGRVSVLLFKTSGLFLESENPALVPSGFNQIQRLRDNTSWGYLNLILEISTLSPRDSNVAVQLKASRRKSCNKTQPLDLRNLVGSPSLSHHL